ncbi:Receptor expression-enhancing protein [Aphelenchoides bicaudatus]|nr:Receptor expression-enhancing protein [Aphelenchoides bicaudatus]
MQFWSWNLTKPTSMPIPAPVQKFVDDVDKLLHQPNKVTDLLGTIEQKSGVKRLHLVGGLVALHALYLLFGHFAALLCNFIGFLYPAYVSVTAIESITKEDDTQWLTYWSVFGFFSVVDFFADCFTYYLPFYWLLKCAFLLWLYLPMTLGAHWIYERFIRPFHAKHHQSIDGFLERNWRQCPQTLPRKRENQLGCLFRIPMQAIITNE